MNKNLKKKIVFAATMSLGMLVLMQSVSQIQSSGILADTEDSAEVTESSENAVIPVLEGIRSVAELAGTSRGAVSIPRGYLEGEAGWEKSANRKFGRMQTGSNQFLRYGFDSYDKSTESSELTTFSNYKKPSAQDGTAAAPNMIFGKMLAGRSNIFLEDNGANIFTAFYGGESLYAGPGMRSSSGITMVTNIDEMKDLSKWSGNNELFSDFYTRNNPSTGELELLGVTDTNLRDKNNSPIRVESKLSPNLNKNGIKSEFSFTNTGSTPFTMVPIKMMDTALQGNDDIPVKAIGENKGMYIDNGKYRMNYTLTGYDGAPTNWFAGRYTHPYTPSLKSMLAPLSMENWTDESLLVSGQENLNIAAGETLFGPGVTPIYPGESTSLDSAMYFKWAPITLAPGETKSVRYDLGVSLTSELTEANIKNSITAINENENININNIGVGDSIDYQVKLSNPNGVSSWRDVNLSVTLPEYVDPESEATLNLADGTKKQVSLAEIYNEENRTINLPVGTIEGNQEASLSFKVKVLPEANNQQLTLKSTAVGTSAGGSPVTQTDEITTGLIQSKIGTVTAHYRDDVGNSIRNSTVIEGALDEAYTLDTPEILGYVFDKVIKGASSGTYTNEAQEVIFSYIKIKDISADPKPQIIEKGSDPSTLKAEDFVQNVVAENPTFTFLNQVTDTSEVGVQIVEVEITAPNSNPVVVKVPVVIKDENTVINPDQTRMITGNDFAINRLDIKGNQAYVYDKITSNSTPKAWNITTGELLPVTVQSTTVPIDADVPTAEYKAVLQADGVTKEIKITVSGQLTFTVPEVVDFGEVGVTTKIELINRQRLDWAIEVDNSLRSPWSITVQADALKLGNETIKDSLVFVDSNGTEKSLSNAVLIAKEENSSNAKTIVQWGKDRGLLLKTLPGGAKTNKAYESQLTWTLHDTPDAN